MSFANYDEIDQICCDWDNHQRRSAKDVISPSDPITDTLLTQSNRWWETVVKEVEWEREQEAELV